ncbi:hypothetical protein EMIHUDRAFT_470519, partial [Emiliania huxleyi CCMP1516]|uniref:HECT-type E3 ubiquitin transferase n=2 Tax=Emiliania huxleyi TaxID=2903 RepID=A0A0D3IWE5_EMIH1
MPPKRQEDSGGSSGSGRVPHPAPVRARPLATTCSQKPDPAPCASVRATRSSKRSVSEREAQPAPKRPRSDKGKSKQRSMDTTSERADEPAGDAPRRGNEAAASSSGGGSSHEPSAAQQRAEARQAALEAAEREALEMLDESSARARAGAPSWGGPSHALQGLLRKLGAGLDDLLPSASSHGRLKTILAGLKGPDESMQLASLTELCEVLSIGTEESMSSLSVDVFTPLLISLLRQEHNPDMMLLASRALCHLMDAIPSSSAAIVHFDGVPLFCERLLSIEYIDLAEQALHALEKLSQEHPLAVLRAGGMLAVLQYVDFFAMGVQRRAVATAANMCRGLPVECAHLVADSVPLLSNLLSHHDQKLLENVCLAFARLAEAFSYSAPQLEMLAAQGLLPNVLRLVGGMASPGQSDAPVAVSDATYTMLLRMLATLCHGSASLCKQLLQLDASSTLHDVLSADATASQGSGFAAAISRPHDQLYQVLALAHELLPPLPKGSPFSAGAARLLAPKRRSKRNPEGEAAPVADSSAGERTPTEREQALLDQPELVELYASRLFALFMHVHSGAVNASVRSKSLSCMAKVLHFYPAAGLRDMVRSHAIAAFLAPLITSQEHASALLALHMAEILMTKLPAVYTDKFLREGVFDAAGRLAAQAPPPAAAGTAAATAAAAATASASATAAAVPFSSASGGASSTPSRPTPPPSAAAPPPSQAPRRTSRHGRPADADDAAASSLSSATSAAAAAAAAAAAMPPPAERQPADRRRSSAASTASSGARAEAAAAPAPMPPPAPRLPHLSSAALAAQEVAASVASRAARFHEMFVSSNPTLAAAVTSGEGSATLRKLRSLATSLSDESLYSTVNPKVPLAGSWTTFADVRALRQLASLLDEVGDGVSTFELAKSGLVEALLTYLTDADAV